MFPNTSGLLLQAPSPLPAAGSGGEAESGRLARIFSGVSGIIWDWGSPGKMLAVQNAPGKAKLKTRKVWEAAWAGDGDGEAGSRESSHGVLGTGCSRVARSNLSDTSLTASLERGLNSDEVPGREGYPG